MTDKPEELAETLDEKETDEQEETESKALKPAQDKAVKGPRDTK